MYRNRYIIIPPSTIHHPPSTTLAYLDTNAHVVETVWVARMGVGYIYIYKMRIYIYMYIYIYIYVCDHERICL